MCVSSGEGCGFNADDETNSVIEPKNLITKGDHQVSLGIELPSIGLTIVNCYAGSPLLGGLSICRDAMCFIGWVFAAGEHFEGVNRHCLTGLSLVRDFFIWSTRLTLKLVDVPEGLRSWLRTRLHRCAEEFLPESRPLLRIILIPRQVRLLGEGEMGVGQSSPGRNVLQPKSHSWQISKGLQPKGKENQFKAPEIILQSDLLAPSKRPAAFLEFSKMTPTENPLI